MAIVKVQSKIVASGSGLSTASATGAGYASATGAGHLLVLVAWCAATSGENPTEIPSIAVPVTTGFTWTQAQSATFQDNPGFSTGRVSLFYIANASSMGSSLTTKVSVSKLTQASSTIKVEFVCYEFSGIVTTSAVDTSAELSSQTTSPNSAGNLTTSFTDLILVATQGEDNTSNTTAGSGYTLDFSSTNARRGQIQEILNQTAGTIATGFAGQLGSKWGCLAVAFKGLSAGADATCTGISLAISVHTPSATASSSASPSGLSLVMSLGAALGGGATASASPSGLSMTILMGTVSAGVGINWGNVIAGSSTKPGAVNSTYFYYRAVGILTPPQSGLYTLGLNAEGGANLFVAGQPVVKAITASQAANGTATYTNSGQMTLGAGIQYPFVIEWAHGTGSPYELQFLWTLPGGSVGVVPTGNLSFTGTWWNGSAGAYYPNAWN